MEINGETSLYVILGNPIAHTLSPAMYNAAFSALQINSIYLAHLVKEDRLRRAVEGLKALGVRGGNVTIPFKEKIIPYLDEVSESARLLGAVNTLYRDVNERLCGANTDGQGFIEMLRQKRPEALKEKSAVILGAGGSARAVAVALALTGIKEITLVNRDQKKAELLAALLRQQGAVVRSLGWDDLLLAESVHGTRLLINTTPLGMEPETAQMPPLRANWFSKSHIVVDLIYKPKETLLLQEAQKRGARTVNGSGMLLEQALLSFEIFTGGKAPAAVMSAVLERWL